MKKIIQLPSVLFITCFISFSLSASEEIIKGRKQLFKKNYQTAKAVSAAIKSGDYEKAQDYLKEVSENFKKLLDYFPEDSQTGFDTEALPAIWQNADEFITYMQNASTNALMLAKKLEEDAPDIMTLEKQLLWDSCSTCHKRFRLKK